MHARHLQTKVDAAAFAGGAAWGFPCGADIDAEIEKQARLYVGSHTAADGTVVTSPHNPQLSGVGADRIYTSLNQAQWWSGGFPASDFSSPLGSVCESKILDVKATHQDPPLLLRVIPLFPDIKRKARVQIEEVSGLTGLLPIAVRLPQPLCAAAIFYDEGSPTKQILAIKPFRQVCLDPDDLSDCVVGVPPVSGTGPPCRIRRISTGTWASFNVTAKTGVVVATSVRPACGAGTPPAGPPCLEHLAVGDRHPHRRPLPAGPGRRCSATTRMGAERRRRCARASTSSRATDSSDDAGAARRFRMARSRRLSARRATPGYFNSALEPVPRAADGRSRHRHARGRHPADPPGELVRPATGATSRCGTATFKPGERRSL